MGNKRAPWFAFDVVDWLTSIDIQHMTLAEVGAYINLLARAWDSDPIATLPNDPSKLWKLAGARSLAEFEVVAPVVLSMFEDQGGRLVNRRLLEETARLSVAEATRAEKARNAANARWGKPDAQACLGMHSDACDAKQRTETDSDIKQTTESVGKTESVGSLDVLSQSQPDKPGDSATPPTQSTQDVYAALCADFDRQLGNGPLPGFKWAQLMAQKWINLRNEVKYRSNYPEEVNSDDFQKLVSQNWLQKAGFSKPVPRGEIELCMTWAIKVSRKKKPTDKGHWGEPNVLEGSAGFVNAFGAIRAQCLNYYAAIKTKKRAIAERSFYNFEAMKDDTAPFDDGSKLSLKERIKAVNDIPDPILDEPVTTPATTQNEPTKFEDKDQKKLWGSMKETLAEMRTECEAKERDLKWKVNRYKQLVAGGMSKTEADIRANQEAAGTAPVLSAVEIAKMLSAERMVEEAA